jgi:hypothetical protein
VNTAQETNINIKVNLAYFCFAPYRAGILPGKLNSSLGAIIAAKTNVIIRIEPILPQFFLENKHEPNLEQSHMPKMAFTIVTINMTSNMLSTRYEFIFIATKHEM